MPSFFNSRDSEESINPGLRWCPIVVELIVTLKAELMEEIHNIEQFFIKLHNIYAFMCQISFFMLCEQQFDTPDFPDLRADKNIVVALTTVLFYSVFGYFASKIRDLCRGTRSRSLSPSPSVANYFKWLCKIFLEWAKAAVVVLCLREQGIQYEPKMIYSLITFIYYLCTERIFIEIFPQLVETLSIEKLENLEHLYVPLVMNVLAIAAGFAVGVYQLYVNFNTFIVLSLYFMVYLRVKDAYYNYWDLLVAERDTYSSFKVANKSDIEEWDDICAVCLNNMSRARITPCNHLFHPYCLKQCLRNSFYCPLCKQHFRETRMAIK